MCISIGKGVPVITCGFDYFLFLRRLRHIFAKMILWSGDHHHHHVVPPVRIFLTLSRHFPLSFIASGKSSGLQPVSSHSCCMYVRAGHPAFEQPYVGVHRSTSLMSSSLLLQQCPACLVCLILLQKRSMLPRSEHYLYTSSLWVYNLAMLYHYLGRCRSIAFRPLVGIYWNLVNKKSVKYSPFLFWRLLKQNLLFPSLFNRAFMFPPMIRIFGNVSI